MRKAGHNLKINYVYLTRQVELWEPYSNLETSQHGNFATSRISFLDFLGNIFGRVTPELGDLGCPNFLTALPATSQLRDFAISALKFF